MADVTIDIVAKDSFSGVLGNFGSIMTGIESVVNLAKDAFDAIAKPIINFGLESTLAAARVSELQAVNQILGENAGIASGAIIEAAQAVRDMGIEAGVSQQVIAEFVKANLDIAYAADVARVAQDAAVISGLNSTEVTSRIIDGIVTLNPLILRNAGIIVDLQLGYQAYAAEMGIAVTEMTTAEKQQVALNLVLEAGAGIAGAYAAAMEEPGKVLRSFPRYFDDIMIAVGEPFQEAFGTTIFAFADLAKWIGEAVSEGGEFRPFLEDVAEGVSNLAGYVAGLVEAFIDAGFASAEFVENLVSFLPQNVQDVFYIAFNDGILAAIDAVDWSIVSDAIISMFESIDWELLAETVKESAIVILETLEQAISEADWTAVGTAFGESLADAIRGGDNEGVINALFDFTDEIIYSLGEILAGAIAGAFNIEVSSSFEEAIEQWKGFFSGFGPWLKNWASGIWGSITDGLAAGWADITYFFRHPFEVAARCCQAVSRYRQPVNRIHANRTRLDWWPDRWYRLNDYANGVISGNVGQPAFAAVPTLA